MAKLFSNKKILIAGSGAVGSFFGGLMIREGLDVTFLARAKRLKQLKDQFLYIRSDLYGQIEILPKVVEKPDLKYDVIIIAVKSHQTEEICKALILCKTDATVVFSLQNGIDNYTVLSNFFKKNQIVLSALSTCLTIDTDGAVVHSYEGYLKIGSYYESARSSVNIISNILNFAQIPHEIVSNIKQAQWEKLLWNTAFNPLSTLLDVTCGRMAEDEGIRENMLHLMYEVKKAAQQDGIVLDDKKIYKSLIISEKTANFRTSMLQDIQSLKKPEIDGILLPIIKKIKQAGLNFTFHEFLYNIINFKFGNSFLYTPRLAADVILYNNKMDVLLIERKNPPYGWAIPGGFVDYNETVENAARREILEETHINVDEITLLGIYSDPIRDKRGHTVSAVYYAKTDKKPEAADDALSARFFCLSNLPDLAFDHNKILKDFEAKIKTIGSMTSE
jgi:2-dehydropantoate 2-reductase